MARGRRARHERQTGTDGVSVLAELVTTNAELGRIEQRLHLLVLEARRAGCSWAAIASATGVSPHTARKRWPSPPADAADGLQAVVLEAASKGISGTTLPLNLPGPS